MADEYLDGLNVDRMASNWRRNILNAPNGTSHLIAEMDGDLVGFASLGPAREAGAAEAGQL